MKTEEKQLGGYAFGNLTEQDVRVMVQRYYDSLKNPPPFDPLTYVKSIWFGLDQINYIQSRLVTENTDGVRIYFGNYPQYDSDGKAFPNPYTNSVIFVSTYADGVDPQTGTKLHKDYFDEIQHMIPQDRGEQCQPNCGDTIPVTP